MNIVEEYNIKFRQYSAKLFQTILDAYDGDYTVRRVQISKVQNLIFLEMNLADENGNTVDVQYVGDVYDEQFAMEFHRKSPRSLVKYVDMDNWGRQIVSLIVKLYLEQFVLALLNLQPQGIYLQQFTVYPYSSKRPDVIWDTCPPNIPWFGDLPPYMVTVGVDDYYM